MGKYLEPDGRTVLYGYIKHEASEEARSRKRILKREGRGPLDSDVAFMARPSLLRSVWHILEVRNNPKYAASVTAATTDTHRPGQTDALTPHPASPLA